MFGSWQKVGLLLLMMTTMAACKQQDRLSPSVAISEPLANQRLEGNTSFLVAGKATDNLELSYLSAVLFDSQSGAIMSSGGTVLSGKEDEFSFEMDAGDRYTPSGSYSLRVVAEDASGNRGAAQTTVSITEYPLAFLGWGIALNTSTDQWQLLTAFVDSNGVTLNQGPAGLKDVSDILADNRNESLVAIQSFGGAIRAYDPRNFDNLFQVELNEGISQPSLWRIGMSSTDYYLVAQQPPYLRLWKPSGAAAGDIPSMLYPGTSLLVDAERIYAGQQGILGSPTKLDFYDRKSEQLRASLPLDWAPLKLVMLGDAQLMAFGNDGGLGKYALLDATSLQVADEGNLPAEWVDAASGNGRVWVLTALGLYEYQLASGTFSSQLVGGNYSSLAFDIAQSRLALGGSQMLEIRSVGGGLLNQIALPVGQARRVVAIYNK